MKPTPPHATATTAAAAATAALAALSALQPFSPSAFSASASASASASPPNIIILIADDLGYGDTGCYGANSARLPTPNIDRAAAAGLRFTHAYATSATCTPSRYSLLTGEYPWRRQDKKIAILNGDAALVVDTSRPTLASFLQQAGYATALVGKWHLGLGDGSHPLDFNADLKPGPLEVGYDTAFFIPATVDRVPCVFIDGHRVANLDPKDPIAISYTKRIPNSDPLGTEHPELLAYPANRSHSKTIINHISRIGYMSGGQSARWVDEDIAATLVARATAVINAHAASVPGISLPGGAGVPPADEGRPGPRPIVSSVSDSPPNQKSKTENPTPFFLYLGTHDPHVPHMPAPRFRGKSDLGIRGDAILQFDWTVGQILDALDRAGIADNTLLLITSDNGPVLFDGYFDGSVEANRDHRPAGGLRGWKYLRYEGGVRVPLIARWPARIAPGATTDAMFCLMDLFPSIAAILDRPYPADAGRDGMDLSTVLLGQAKTSPRATLVVDGNGGVLALRDGDWKFIPSNANKNAKSKSPAKTAAKTAAKSPANAAPADDENDRDLRDPRYADMRPTDDLLFNLADDPAETTNLAAKNPEKLKAMRAKLAAIRADAK